MLKIVGQVQVPRPPTAGLSRLVRLAWSYGEGGSASMWPGTSLEITPKLPVGSCSRLCNQGTHSQTVFASPLLGNQSSFLSNLGNA